MVTPVDSATWGRLNWRCRRGTKELDHVFGTFLHSRYAQASDQVREAFERLTEEQDPDVYDWLMNICEPEDRNLRLIIKELQKLSLLR